MARSTAVRELQNRLAPVTLAREHTLPVPDPLLPLFPFGGLQKGQSVGFRGSGSWSVALSLVATALGNDGWMAVVGVEELGLLAAAEQGVRLDRLLLVESLPSARLAPVIATLIEAIDIVAIAPQRMVSNRDARRLAARSRERGAVLFHLDGGRHWPQALDLTVSTEPTRWEGAGQGNGHLRWRRLSVEAVGRRSSARRRRVSVLLPGPDGNIAPADTSDPLTDAEPAPQPFAQVG